MVQGQRQPNQGQGRQPQGQREIPESVEGCPFCEMATGKQGSYKIYEDELNFACLDINPATKGHVILFPKKHFSTIFQMPTKVYFSLFQVARVLSSILKAYGADGINIFYSAGPAAGQKASHLLVHLIPRYENDNVNFDWKAQDISEEDFKELQSEFIEMLKATQEQISQSQSQQGSRQGARSQQSTQRSQGRQSPQSTQQGQRTQPQQRTTQQPTGKRRSQPQQQNAPQGQGRAPSQGANQRSNKGNVQRGSDTRRDSSEKDSEEEEIQDEGRRTGQYW